MEQQREVQWETAKEFEAGGIVVSVSCLPLKFPRYSIALGMRTSSGKVGRHFPVFVEGQGKLTAKRIDMELISRLVRDAEEWVLGQCQRCEDEFLAYQSMREQEQVDREKGPAKKAGIKTLGKRDKAQKSA
jgi:hypothetical protein